MNINKGGMLQLKEKEGDMLHGEGRGIKSNMEICCKRREREREKREMCCKDMRKKMRRYVTRKEENNKEKNIYITEGRDGK